MKYIDHNKREFILGLILFLSFNLYFIFLVPNTSINYLLYLDFLIGTIYGIFIGIDSYRAIKREQKKQELLKSDELICWEFSDLKEPELIEHDIHVLQGQLHDQIVLNDNLQDYITKWCHEVKLPLSASLLMLEKIENPAVKKPMKEQLEKINQQLNSALVGCKVQSNIYDLQVKPNNLSECVKTSIKNNQFFLIQNHFNLDIDVTESQVYTDKEWIVFVIDQLISNAIKYAKEPPVLKIWSEVKGNSIFLYIEDHGEGISKEDIRRIYEKGYTGINRHNGKYKSTGMGLYMTHLIIEKLGHQIEVESIEGEYTRFKITFQDNRDYFNL